MKTIKFTRVKNDVNGNPRYVCHYLDLLTEAELAEKCGFDKYEIALKRARAIGGRKFNNKQYGGGIVFQSYALDETADAIAIVTGRTNSGGICC